MTYRQDPLASNGRVLAFHWEHHMGTTKLMAREIEAGQVFTKLNGQVPFLAMRPAFGLDSTCLWGVDPDGNLTVIPHGRRVVLRAFSYWVRQSGKVEAVGELRDVPAEPTEEEIQAKWDAEDK